MARHNQEFPVKGHDGKTADLPYEPKIKKSPVMSKAPYIGQATVTCGECGTSDAISGRIGTSVNSFVCRCCESICKSPRPFTFAVVN